MYRPANGVLADVEGAGGVSPADAPRAFRALEATYAEAWFKTITTRSSARLARVRVAIVAGACRVVGAGAAQAQLRPFAVVDDAIPHRLTGAPGDPARGRAIVADRQVGLCLLCHSGPFPEERFQGDLAPDLPAPARARPRASCACASSTRAA